MSRPLAAPLVAVVDDDAAIRTGLSSLLRSSGYAVRLCSSAEDFLETLSETVPSCVITDIQMPGISGLELQSVLRVEYGAMPVLVMTAFPEPAARERALVAGAIGFLSKPFEVEEVLAPLRRAIGR